MILVDTDVFSLFVLGHPKVLQRAHAATDILAISIITRMEILQGRFAAIFKAADGHRMQQAQERLDRSERDLSGVPVIPINAATAALFDDRRQDKKLKKIGRGDLIIACAALAHRATLVTRNEKDFKQVSGVVLENWVD